MDFFSQLRSRASSAQRPTSKAEPARSPTKKRKTIAEHQPPSTIDKARARRTSAPLPQPPETKKQRTAPKELRNYPFETEYGDHFETSSQAFEDLAPVLRWLAKRRALRPADLHIYDPYFCQGTVVAVLGKLGFGRVTNRNRDFYSDIAARAIPPFDALVTNPPYSGNHKDRIIEYCLNCGKPWALLVPNYVATKRYFSALLEGTSAPEPLFLVPEATYEYSHPEGTGHDSSPFRSLWIIGCPDKDEADELWHWAQQDGRWPPGALRAMRKQDLVTSGAVPIAKRSNPKQRKKLMLQRAGTAGSTGGR